MKKKKKQFSLRGPRVVFVAGIAAFYVERPPPAPHTCQDVRFCLCLAKERHSIFDTFLSPNIAHGEASEASEACEAPREINAGQHNIFLSVCRSLNREKYCSDIMRYVREQEKKTRTTKCVAPHTWLIWVVFLFIAVRSLCFDQLQSPLPLPPPPPPIDFGRLADLICLGRMLIATTTR